MKNAKMLREEIAHVSALGAPLAVKAKEGQATAEEIEQLSQYGKQLEDLTKQFEAAKEREAQAEALLKSHESFTKPTASAAGMIPHGDDPGLQGREREEKIDLRSPGRRFIESEQYQRALKSGAWESMRQDRVRMPGLRRPRVAYDGGVMERRDLITSASASASQVLPDIYPGLFRPLEPERNVRSLFINGMTSSDSVTIIQESTISLNATEVAEATDDTGTTAATGLKPESDISFTEVSFPVRTIAHYMRVTRQMLQDMPAMESYINEYLLRGLARRENDELINGNGTAPNLTGLLNTSGIQVLDDTYFTTNPVNDAATDNETLNRLRRAKTLIRTVGGATPTFILMNPEDLEFIDTLTDANLSYTAGGPFGTDQRTLWGLPITEDENLAAGTAIVGDGGMAAVLDRMDSAIYTTDSHADYFIRNILVILAEERLAFPVFRPVAFAEVDLYPAVTP